jgi:arsenite/tail-anchored protein-transporting ATPase
MSRILIFTGKGGVGKTTVAAAHARKSEQEGKKTLLISTDMAHNLSDLFERSFGKEATAISEYLDVLEVDPSYVMENDFKNIMRAFQNIINSTNMGVSDQDDITMLPGMEELFSLLKILDIYESDIYERIVVDCAPTGETLSLLKFPELMSWYMEKFFPVGKLAMRVLSPISKTLFKVELPDKQAMSDVEKMYMKLIKLQALMKDREVTSVRLVTIPEKMVVEETKRNYMYMNLYNYNVDAIFINRILPADIDNPFFNEWLDIQKGYIEELLNVFQDTPIYSIRWYDTDLCGMEAIDRICKDILNESNLFDMKKKQQGETYEMTEDGYLLSLFLPFLKKDELELHQSGTDVIIKIGNFKRNIPIPNTLRNYSIASAKIEEQVLRIHFVKAD